jgi:predicted ATPase
MILRRIALASEKAADAWYFGIPAIAQLADEPLVLNAAVTVIVGENGSGNSTLLEAVAAAWGARLAGEVKHWAPAAGEEDGGSLAPVSHRTGRVSAASVRLQLGLPGHPATPTEGH